RRLIPVVAGILAAMCLIGFVVLVDRGAALPGAHSLRAQLDRHELSFFRPAATIAVLNEAAHDLRDDFTSRLDRICLPRGRFPEKLSDPSSRDADPWSMSQMAAGVF